MRGLLRVSAGPTPIFFGSGNRGELNGDDVSRRDQTEGIVRGALATALQHLELMLHRMYRVTGNRDRERTPFFGCRSHERVARDQWFSWNLCHLGPRNRLPLNGLGSNAAEDHEYIPVVALLLPEIAQLQVADPADPHLR